MAVQALSLLLAVVASRRVQPSLFTPGVFADSGSMINSGTPPGVSPSTDCAIRSLAYNFGKTLKPEKGEWRALHDALQLGACGLPTPPPAAGAWRPPSTLRSSAPQHLHSVLHVDPTATSDTGATGSVDMPFHSVVAALHRSREMSKPLVILLRHGTHYLGGTAPLELYPEDSGLHISNFPGEEARLSGGVPLNPQWTRSTACGAGCFQASLPNVSSIPGLRRNGVREVRARWPNFDEERDSVIDGNYRVHNGRDGWVTTPTTWKLNGVDMNDVAGPWPPAQAAVTHIISATDWPDIEWPMLEPLNGTSSSMPTNDQWTGEGDWGQFWLGVGGTCADRSPAVGYWCSPHAPRGIGPATHPGGIDVESIRGRKYKDPAGAIIHAWMPYHWYTYMFEVRTSRLIPNTSNPGEVFPNTNGIWGKCEPGPTTCQPGIEVIGNRSSRAACLEAVANASTMSFQSWVYFHLTFPQSSYRGLCYGITYGLRGAPQNQSDVDSGTLATAGNSYLEFSRGGFQGGEGSNHNQQTADWYIENVFEELDSEREWIFNETTRILYYRPNSTETGALDEATGLPTGEFSATGAKVLFNVSGNQSHPVRNISISGLVMRDTSYTYMDPHGLPSAGDWALQKQGAITLVGTEGTKITDNLFSRLDGNAIFMGGYHRDLLISNNEFEYIGDSAMASWGDTSNNLNANGTISVPYAVGPDGRDGNQNRGARVVGNVARELGIWQKQSSMWFQAVTAGTHFEGNVFFNGPRAAVNWNDGFGGGDELLHNLLINTCRESGDHGPWNSWNRVPYITEDRHGPGRPSIIPKDVHIYENLMLANYNAICAIDTDDGSSYIKVYDNVLAYASAGLKSDFGGHAETYSGNLLAYVGDCIMDGMNTDRSPGHGLGFGDQFVNNTCVYRNNLTGYQSDCFTNPQQPPTGRGWDVHGNQVYSQTGTTTVCLCPPSTGQHSTRCNASMPLQQWVALGHDRGSTSRKWPADEELVAWAKRLLKLPQDYI